MARSKKARASYETVAADSGYLSDLVETARQSDKTAAELMRSPATSSSVELIMSKFNDTEWDVKATGARLVKLNQKCRDLEKRVKYPTRFPIIPLESTLARAKAKADVRRKRKVLADIDTNPTGVRAAQAEQTVVADGYGRTHAASKRLSATTNTTIQPPVVLRPDKHLSRSKRRRS